MKDSIIKAQSITIDLQDIMNNNSVFVWLFVYALGLSLALIIIIIRSRKKRHKFMLWKKDTINIFIFKREWEANNDAFIQQLWDENQRLVKENALLKKRNLMAFGYMMLILGIALISGLFKKDKSQKGQVESEPELSEVEKATENDKNCN